jgi:hypothetical protein
MTDIPVFDFSRPSASVGGGDDTPVFDPKKPSEALDQEDIPSYPTPQERFIAGMTDAPVAAMQIASRFLPAGKQPEASEAKKADRKLKAREIEGFDPIRMLGNIADPIPAGIAYKVAKVVPKIAQGAMTGGIYSLLTPLSEADAKRDDFGWQKTKQVAEGMALGFGFTMAGKGAGKGLEVIGDWLVRNKPENIMSTAVQSVLRRIHNDAKAQNLTAQNAIDLIVASNDTGVPMVAGDIGRRTRALGGQAVRKGDQASSDIEHFLQTRDGQAGTRLQQAIAGTLFSGPTAYQATDMLIKTRSESARPLWQKADDLQGIWSPYLGRLLENPDVRQGLRRGFAIERNVADAENRPFDPHMLGIDLDVEGNIKFVKTPNLRVLQMAKEGLDDMIEEARDEMTGRLTKRGIGLQKLKTSYLDEIDSMDTKGVYKRARQEWAGYSQSMDAVKLGQTAFGRRAEESEKMFNELSENDKEFYRLGLADKLLDRLGGVAISGDESKALLNNVNTKNQIRHAFRSEKDFNSFVDSVAKERQMFETKFKILGGSQSLEKLQEDVSGFDITAGQKAAGAFKSLIKGDIGAAIGNILRLHEHFGMKTDPKLADAIGEVLFTPLKAGSEMEKRLRAGPAPRVGGRTSAVGQAIRNFPTAPLGATAGEFTRPSTSDTEERATGGPVEAGRPYVVGEQGPEIVVPQQSGQVIPSQRGPYIPDYRLAMEYRKDPLSQKRVGEAPGGSLEGPGRPTSGGTPAQDKVWRPKSGQDAYDEGFKHAKRGIGRRTGVYDQKSYDAGYFAGRGDQSMSDEQPDPIHPGAQYAEGLTPELAKQRLGQLLRDRSMTKKSGFDTESSAYAHYNSQIRMLREYLRANE